MSFILAAWEWGGVSAIERRIVVSHVRPPRTSNEFGVSESLCPLCYRGVRCPSISGADVCRIFRASLAIDEARGSKAACKSSCRTQIEEHEEVDVMLRGIVTVCREFARKHK